MSLCGIPKAVFEQPCANQKVRGSDTGKESYPISTHLLNAHSTLYLTNNS